MNFPFLIDIKRSAILLDVETVMLQMKTFLKWKIFLDL